MTSSADETVKKVTPLKAQSTKKRPALADVTNQKNGSQPGPRTSVLSSKPMVRVLFSSLSTIFTDNLIIPTNLF